MKFIHAADLHIESPYRGIRSENRELGEALLTHGIRAYEKLIDVCIEHTIDFLLIAGDSFDSDSGSLGAQYRFFRGLERLNAAGIMVYIICGNHDPLNQWAKNFSLPKNVHRFGPDTVEMVEFINAKNESAAIYGVSYGDKVENRRLVEQYIRKDNAEFSIGLLHGTLAGMEHKNPYCPFTMDDLRASKMDYWALGHIHKREIVHENSPMVVYPGNLQGRHFNETGEKGCYLIEVNRGRIENKSFISLTSVVFEYMDHDISQVSNLSELFDLLGQIRNNLLESQLSYMLRLRLTGMTNLYETLTKSTEMEALIRTFNEENNYATQFIHLDRIENQAVPTIDLEERKQSADFMGDVIRRFEEYEKNQDKLDELANGILNELKTTKVGRHLYEIQDENELKAVINNAKWMCISGLMSKSEES
jgi:DNA repair exonuclease SbcCD nuclease subunit